VILEGRGVTKCFGGVVAIDRVDFAVEKGEIFGIIGPNGAGKTTLMNLISRLHPLSAGEIRFRGRPLVEVPAHAVARLGIARTFQIVRPFPGMSVRENVAIGPLFGPCSSASAAPTRRWRSWASPRGGTPRSRR